MVNQCTFLNSGIKLQNCHTKMMAVISGRQSQYQEMVMEGTNIPPVCVRAECHCEVLGSQLTAPVINDDRVWTALQLDACSGPAHHHR